MTSGGFPESGIPLASLVICVDCEIAFKGSDRICPSCASTLGLMLLPRKFIEVDNDEARTSHGPGLEDGRRDDAAAKPNTNRNHGRGTKGA